MRKTLLILALIISLPQAWAMYADVTFKIANDGFVSIEGISNHPQLQVGTYDNLTTKTGKYWLINFTTQDALDSFVYAVELPQGASVNYVSGKNFRLLTEGNRVVVRGSGRDTILHFIVQYSLEPTPENNNSFVPLALILIVVAAIVLMLTAYFTQRNSTKTTQTKSLSKTPSYVEGLPQRQQQILSLLSDAGGALTQKQIENTLKLPKSSVSRNVEALRRRGLIKKAQSGMTNTVALEEQKN